MNNHNNLVIDWLPNHLKQYIVEQKHLDKAIAAFTKIGKELGGIGLIRSGYKVPVNEHKDTRFRIFIILHH